MRRKVYLSEAKLLKIIKKLRCKPGDILVCQIQNDWDDETKRVIGEVMDEAGLKNVPMLFLPDFMGRPRSIEFQKAIDGKIPVYMDNLEFLEYLNERKGKQQ